MLRLSIALLVCGLVLSVPSLADEKAKLTDAEVESLSIVQQEIEKVTLQAQAAIQALQSLQGKAAGKICSARNIPFEKCKIDLPGKKATLSEDPKPEPKK